ncbi:hypothetical protein ACFE04_015928 [Oxalis oulophora]
MTQDMLHDNASILLQNSANSSSHHSYVTYNHRTFDYVDQVRKKTQQNVNSNRSLNNMPSPTFEATLGFNRSDHNDDDDDSGIETPPLWPRTSPNQQHYRTLSPTSRTQAIARGQKELMEMVSMMPESCYELSLKDLVQRSEVEEEKVKIYPKGRNKSGKKVEMMKRSESLDHNGGLLLKMVVLPVPFKLTKKKSKKHDLSTNMNESNKVISPRPSVSDNNNDHKDWWKKRSEGSNNGRRSTSSRSSSQSRHGSQGCLSFLRTKRKGISTE